MNLQKKNVRKGLLVVHAAAIGSTVNPLAGNFLDIPDKT